MRHAIQRTGLTPRIAATVLAMTIPATAWPEGAASVRVTTAEAEALVREIGASVEQLRGLRFKTPVAMQVISGATARENFKAMMEPGVEEQTRQVQAAYVQLGLVPPNADLNKGYLELAEKGIAGYYEHGSKTFYLVDHTAPDEVRGVIAHELTHALEDQTYDLDAVAKKRSGTADASTAATALIEGSAMVVMFAFLSREEGQKKAREDLEKVQSQRVDRFRIAPSFTQRTLTLPYLLGFSFLLHGKPWDWAFGNGVLVSDIAKAYADPPRSTREILHPEQFWEGRTRRHSERLKLPDLSAAFGKGWTKTMEGSIGELGLAVLTGSREPIELPWALLPSRWTNEAAAGTLGDVYQHYVNGERSATVLLTRWETERDGWLFQEALATRGKHFAQFGSSVLVLAGDFTASADAISLAAFQGMSSSVDP
jgi:hypothetical protein